MREFITEAAGVFSTPEKAPNQAYAVDAPVASLFHVVGLGRRATDQHR